MEQKIYKSCINYCVPSSSTFFLGKSYHYLIFIFDMHIQLYLRIPVPDLYVYYTFADKHSRCFRYLGLLILLGLLLDACMRFFLFDTGGRGIISFPFTILLN